MTVKIYRDSDSENAGNGPESLKVAGGSSQGGGSSGGSTPGEFPNPLTVTFDQTEIMGYINALALAIAVNGFQQFFIALPQINALNNANSLALIQSTQNFYNRLNLQQQITNYQNENTQNKTQLASISPTDPQVPILNSQIARINTQIMTLQTQLAALPIPAS